MDPDLIMDFFQAVAVASRSTIHGRILYGRNLHHKIEAIFKAFARCLMMAAEIDPRQKSVPSTKGIL
jgi:imidazoleglycerol-phosphate dehydratase